MLTGFRLYLDQTDHALSRVFGNPSGELERVKTFKNRLYDKFFGYRFLEALRNHVQHCELPVEIITYDERPVSEKSFLPSHSMIIPKTSLESLSENKDFKQQIIKELQCGPLEIDLRPYVREYISCLVQLHKEIESVFSPTVEQNRIYYEGIIKHFSKHGEKSITHPRFVLLDDNDKKIKTIELYSGFLMIYDTLKVRNANIRDVSKSFVSNIIFSK